MNNRESSDAVKIARLEERDRAKDIEIRDLKLALATSQQNNGKALHDLARQVQSMADQLQPLTKVLPQIEAMLRRESEVTGAAKLGRWIMGSSLLVAAGAVVTGIYQWFSRGGN